MSLVFATKSKLTAIANAIRTRAGSVASMTLDDMADAIPALPNIYAAGDEGKVVDNGALVSQTSTSASANGTYDTTLNNEVVVNVSGGGSTGQKATGTYTPAQRYNTTGNRLITDVTTIGFTPTVFILKPTDVSSVTSTGDTKFSIADNTGTNKVKTQLRITSSGTGNNNSLTSWTTQTDGFLYFDEQSGNIYLRTSSSAILEANVEYTWEAYA